MRTSSLMLAAIESGDWSDATIKATLDAIQEDFGHDLRTAVLMVSHFLRDARDAAILRPARTASMPTGRLTPLVRTLINQAVGFPPTAVPMVKVVAGEEAPCALLPLQVHGRKLIDQNTIQVGAAWLLDRLELPVPGEEKATG